VNKKVQLSLTDKHARRFWNDCTVALLRP